MQRTHSEDRRQLEHLAPLFFAFLLKYINWYVALALAVAAIFYGAFVSPLWGTSRPGEPRISGKFHYAVAVLFLLLLFRRRIEYAAAVWGVLAVGDSLSNTLGRRWGKARLPWNPEKSWLGSLIFLVSGMAAFLILFGWFQGLQTIVASRAILLALIVSLGCTLVESLPALIDDNLLIGFMGAFLVLLGDTVLAGEPRPLGFWGTALLINGALAALVYLLGLVTLSGAVVGLACGALIYWGAGWRSFLLLFLFFVWGTASTRVRRARKEAMGIAQENRGRRSARHAVANCLVGSLLSLGAAFGGDSVLLWKAAILGAFATAVFDTVSTELGQAFGRTPILIPTGKRVPPGTEGAVSLEGTALGLLAAVTLALAAWLSHYLAFEFAMVAVTAALVATTVESWIGAGTESRHPMKNELLNFYNTALGAGLAAGITAWIVGI
ncbi:MAG TPA: DUF92 domain-containing protein [Acidobacteriota bacterium]|jgi:uncharacterized protein (TIGR00297 family)|nr:DUF92 domain-containing protein [Acidobacteriota bacterium]